MDPNDPFILLLQTILGGVVEAVAAKTIDAAPNLARRGKSLLSMMERQPLNANAQAVAAAVEAARQDVIREHRNRDLALSDDTVRDMVALLNHPPFAEEVAKVLLFRGQPDLERLRQHYVGRSGAATSARWQALEEPLLDFFAAIESHLQADLNLGPLLREAAQLATLTKLERSTQLVAEYSRQVLSVQTQIAASTQQSAQDLHSLLLEAGGGNAHLGQMVSLLRTIVERLPATASPPPPADGILLSTEELAYLRKAHADCDRLPLANIPSEQPQPRLQRVFVELRTTQPPMPDQVGRRLQLEPKRMRALQQRLAGRHQAAGRRRAPEVGDEAMALRPLEGEEIGKLAESLQVEEDALAVALRNLTPLEVLAARRQRHSPPHLVILGNPGGGKSTLLGRLASILAAQQLPEQQALWGPDEQGWAQAVAQSFGRWLLPVRVSFHRWDRFAQRPAGRTKDLIDECVRVLEEVSGGEPEALRRQLMARLGAPEPSALLLLDGLDEVADSSRRDRLIAAVRDFCQSHPSVPVLITCRVKPYEQLQIKDKALLQQDATLVLDRLDAAAIDQFVTRWHAELLQARRYSPEKAAEAEARLRQALSERPKLQEMAGTPLLLTMMARVNYEHGLPESRAELYDSLVRELLWEWELHRSDDRTDVPLDQVLSSASPNLGRAQLEQALDRLAYDIHGSSRQQSAVSIPRERLKTAFEALLPGDPKDPKVAGEAAQLAAAILQVIGRRTGLVLELDEGETYQFTHHTLQEYLAARWIATGNLGERKRKFTERVDDEYWREAVYLALGCLASTVNKAYDEALSVVQALLPRTVGGEREQRRALLLGEAFAQQFSAEKLSLAVDEALRTELPLLLQGRLTEAMQDRSVAADQRLAAGLLAADVAPPPAALAGDPVLVPITGFRDKGQSHDFQIGQYPVTNGQYRRFMDAGGYDKDKPWWTPQAIQEIERFWKGWPGAPRFWEDSRFYHSTQPVVGVSWYEAMAYCAWLTEARAGQGKLDQTKHAVRLPTEAEWGWAAAGPARRRYAWGDGFDAGWVNSKESGLGQTTPVHTYPDGATPAGAWAERVWDLCGNVWEWCLDDHETWGKVLRGGAYYGDKAGVVTAARFWLSQVLERQRRVSGSRRPHSLTVVLIAGFWILVSDLLFSAVGLLHRCAAPWGSAAIDFSRMADSGFGERIERMADSGLGSQGWSGFVGMADSGLGSQGWTGLSGWLTAG